MCLWCLHMLHPKVLYPTHTRYIYAYINIPPPLLPVPFLFIILLCSTWMGILSGRRETSCNLSRYRHFHIEKIDRNQRWRSPPRSFFSPHALFLSAEVSSLFLCRRETPVPVNWTGRRNYWQWTQYNKVPQETRTSFRGWKGRSPQLYRQSLRTSLSFSLWEASLRGFSCLRMKQSCHSSPGRLSPCHIQVQKADSLGEALVTMHRVFGVFFFIFHHGT